jgi:hypothetical protein
MNIKTEVVVCLLIAVLFVIPVSSLGNTSLSREANDVTRNSETLLEGGWLEERDGIRILHLNGTDYEMGYQHGILLKDEIQENMRMIGGWLEQNGFPHDALLEIWDVMKDFLPQEYRDEMQGMADGLGISFEEVAIYNTWPAVINHALVTCCNAAAWGSATADDNLYHLRSLDILHPALGLKDPETGTYFRENQVLIVRKPDNRYASVYPEFAGAVCSWGGINEAGISIGADTCLTNDSTFRGISAAFRMRMVLDYAATAEEAITIMNSSRTCGWNYIISDEQIPVGCVIEQTANLSYVGTWFDPVESTSPFWEIENVVRRGPMFISPECAATQPRRQRYDPSGLRGLLLFVVGKNRYFTVWNQYRALSKEFEHQRGTLEMNSTMSLLRDVYLGKTDVVFSVMQKLYSFSFRALHQWVACPQTGDIVISFAGTDSDTACENPVHYVNLFDLMEAEPLPSIRITRPRKGFRYRFDVEQRPSFSGNTIIFGNITVETIGSPTIERVDFYVDDWLIASDTTYPYECTWDEKAFFNHTLKVVASDLLGHRVTDEQELWIFNI